MPSLGLLDTEDEGTAMHRNVAIFQPEVCLIAEEFNRKKCKSHGFQILWYVYTHTHTHTHTHTRHGAS